jgi:DNA invertase Pin-like site-specific DNA recombinase
MALVHSYILIRTADATDGGVELERLKDEFRRYYDEHFAGSGYHGLGRVYEDRAQAARRGLRSRPGGVRLATDLAEGDVVVFVRLDRSFSNTEDLATTVRVWAKRGVRVILPEVDLDTNDPTAFAELGRFELWAKFEKAATGGAISERIAERLRKGKQVGRPPWGTRVTTNHGRRVLQIVASEFEVGKYVVKCRQNGISFESIWRHLRRNGVDRPVPKSVPLHHKKRRPWTMGALKQAYLGTLKLLAWIAEGKLKEPGT